VGIAEIAVGALRVSRAEEGVARLVEAALHRQRHPEVVLAQRRVAAVLPQRGAQQRLGASRLAGAQVGDAEIVEDPRIARPELPGLLELDQRLLVLAELIERDAERGARIRRVRCDLHRALEVGEPLLALVARQQREAEADLRRDVVGRDRERALEERLGALGIHAEVDVADPHPRLGGLRIDPVGRCVLPQRRGEVAVAKRRVAAFEAPFHRLGHFLARALRRVLGQTLLARHAALLRLEPLELRFHRVALAEGEGVPRGATETGRQGRSEDERGQHSPRQASGGAA
jgi:hypothetical protein